MPDRLTVARALAALDGVETPFVTLLAERGVEVELYKPEGVDKQQPHTRDELYVVIAGSGMFVNGAQRHPFEAGEVLYVPAGVVHRFEEFSDDFATWVVFFGEEFDAV